MKKFISAFIFVLVIHMSLNIENCISQWTQTNTPSAIIYSIGVKDNLIFVGTPLGVFRSINFGNTWQNINLGVVNLYVSTFAVSGQSVFAGTKDRGIFRSTDNGDTWMAANNGLSSTFTTQVLTGKDRVYSVVGGKVYYTQNNGDSWTEMPGVSGVRTIAFKDEQLFAGAEEGIFMTPDNGGEWFKINYSLNVRCMTISAGNIFVGTELSGIYVSSDNGKNFNVVNNGIPEMFTINSLAAIGTSVFAATDGAGVYFSINSGASWLPVNNGLVSQRVLTLHIDKANLFAGTFGGVFISRDNGNSWQNIGEGITNGQMINCFSVSGNNLYVGTDRGRVFVSPDEGVTWKAYSNQGLIKEISGKIVSTVGDINSLFVNGTFIYAATDSGVFRSLDDGITYKPLSLQWRGVNVYSVLVNQNHIYAGTSQGFYFTKDDGKMWNLVDNAFNGLKVTVMKSTGSNFYCTTGNGVTAVINKELISSKLPVNAEIYDLAINKNHIFAATFGTGIYKADSDNSDWEESNEGLVNTQVTSIVSLGEETLIIGTWGSGIFYSTDNGEKWYPANQGLIDMKVRSLIIKGNTLFAGTEQGLIYKRNLSEFAEKD